MHANSIFFIRYIWVNDIDGLVYFAYVLNYRYYRSNNRNNMRLYNACNLWEKVSLEKDCVTCCPLCTLILHLAKGILRQYIIVMYILYINFWFIYSWSGVLFVCTSALCCNFTYIYGPFNLPAHRSPGLKLHNVYYCTYIINVIHYSPISICK